MPSTHANATSRCAKLSALRWGGKEGKGCTSAHKGEQAAVRSTKPAALQACAAPGNCRDRINASSSPGDPLERPLRLLLHHRHGLDGVEQAVLLLAAHTSERMRGAVFQSLRNAQPHVVLAGDAQRADNPGAHRRRLQRCHAPTTEPRRTTGGAVTPSCGQVSTHLSLMYVSSSRLYISEWMFSMAIWKP